MLKTKVVLIQIIFQAPIVCPIFTVLASIYFIITPFIQNPNPIYFLIFGFFILSALMYYIFLVLKVKIPGLDSAYRFLQKLLQVAETDWDNYAEFETAIKDAEKVAN